MKYNPKYYDPFEEALDRLWMPKESALSMKTDIREKDGKLLFDIELPGFKKEDIKIALQRGNLLIEAKHSENSEEKDEEGNVIRRERSSGSCRRSFYVGDDVKSEEIKARFEDGILKVSVPQSENNPEHIREITID